MNYSIHSIELSIFVVISSEGLQSLGKSVWSPQVKKALNSFFSLSLPPSLRSLETEMQALLIFSIEIIMYLHEKKWFSNTFHSPASLGRERERTKGLVDCKEYCIPAPHSAYHQELSSKKEEGSPLVTGALWQPILLAGIWVSPLSFSLPHEAYAISPLLTTPRRS